MEPIPHPYSPKTQAILGRNPQHPAQATPIPRRWQWHYRTLQSLQSRLLGDRTDLLRDAQQPLESHSMDEADSATDEFDHDLAWTLLSADDSALIEIQDAMARIRDGTYGICQQSGQAIAEERLRAVPWTRFTREIEELMEKNKWVSGTKIRAAETVHPRQGVSFVPEDEKDLEAISGVEESQQEEAPQESAEESGSATLESDEKFIPPT